MQIGRQKLSGEVVIAARSDASVALHSTKPGKHATFQTIGREHDLKSPTDDGGAQRPVPPYLADTRDELAGEQLLVVHDRADAVVARHVLGTEEARDASRLHMR